MPLKIRVTLPDTVEVTIVGDDLANLAHAVESALNELRHWTAPVLAQRIGEASIVTAEPLSFDVLIDVDSGAEAAIQAAAETDEPFEAFILNEVGTVVNRESTTSASWMSSTTRPPIPGTASSHT